MIVIKSLMQNYALCLTFNNIIVTFSRFVLHAVYIFK